MKEGNVFRCRRCGDLMRTTMSAEEVERRVENRCPDRKAPGGYWYCDYEELVPKKLSKQTNAGKSEKGHNK